MPELCLGVEVGAVELVEGKDRGGRVGAAATEPRGHRDALVHGDAGAGPSPRPAASAQARRGALDERLPAGAGQLVGSRPGHDHLEPVGGLDGDHVVQVQRQDQRLDVVVAVVAAAEHAQEHVELRVGAWRVITRAAPP